MLDSTATPDFLFYPIPSSRSHAPSRTVESLKTELKSKVGDLIQDTFESVNETGLFCTKSEPRNYVLRRKRISETEFDCQSNSIKTTRIEIISATPKLITPQVNEEVKQEEDEGAAQKPPLPPSDRHGKNKQLEAKRPMRQSRKDFLRAGDRAIFGTSPDSLINSFTDSTSTHANSGASLKEGEGDSVIKPQDIRRARDRAMLGTSRDSCLNPFTDSTLTDADYRASLTKGDSLIKLHKSTNDTYWKEYNEEMKRKPGNVVYRRYRSVLVKKIDQELEKPTITRSRKQDKVIGNSQKSTYPRQSELLSSYESDYKFE